MYEFFLSLYTAGIAGWAVAIPTDVVKNRHQANTLSTSAFQNAKDLFQQRGPRGFFLGAGPILLRAAPANAAAFLGYEAAISFLAYFYKSELWLSSFKRRYTDILGNT